MTTNLVTIPDVPLLRVGSFDASTGRFSADRAMLEAIVRAWESGYTNDPVLKLGHMGHRTQDDGGRAYGQVSNLRLADGGDTLLGDYVNVPEDLAAEMPSAYPYRSVELALNVERRGPDGDVLDTYEAVLTALALLGDTEPAVAGLGVTPAVAASRLPDGMTVSSVSVVLASLPGGRSANYLRDALSRALGGEVLDFTDTDVFTAAPGTETGVVGQRYTVHETTGEIVLEGDPYPVEASALYGTRAETGETAPGLAAAESVTNSAEVPHGNADGADDEGNTNEEESVMENLASLLTEEQMTALGVDVNTPDVEVWDAVLQYAFTPPPTAEAEAGAEVAAGEARVSASVFEGMRTRIAELEQREEQRVEAARVERVEASLDAAVRDGRIGEEEVEAWRGVFAASEENAHALLSQRRPAFNTTERGFATASAHMTPEDANKQFDAFLGSLNIGRTTQQEG